MDSQLVTRSESHSSHSTEMATVVAELFGSFDRFFPQPNWANISLDPRARPAWCRALTLAKLTPTAVRIGVTRASQLEWPPSVGKFIELCQPKIPNEEEARHEAIAACRQLATALEAAERARLDGDPPATFDWDGFPWSHVLVRATAQAVGTLQLRTLSDRDCRMVWFQAWCQMVERFRKGLDLSTPVRRALPKSERTEELRRQRKSEGPTPAGTAAAAALRALLGASS